MTSVKRFNERMAALQRNAKGGGQDLTKSAGYQSFFGASQTHRYSELFTTSKSGNLKLRTDYAHMTEAEIERLNTVMETALNTGETSATEIKEKTRYLKESGLIDESMSEQEFLERASEIEQEALKRFYYDSKNHTTTAAVDAKVSKREAQAALIKIAENHRSPITGRIYKSAIRDYVDKHY